MTDDDNKSLIDNDPLLGGLLNAGQGVAMTAEERWNPKGDDPLANWDDGKTHPDEAAITNPNATHAEKAEAWEHRYERISQDPGVLPQLAALRAESHYEYHQNRIGKDDEDDEGADP